MHETPAALTFTRPLTIRGTTLPTRLLFAPINTGFARKGAPSKRLVSFHAARSGSLIGSSIVGNVSAISGNLPNGGTATLCDPAALPRYRALTRAISRRGSIPGIQLALMPPGLDPSRSWRASNNDNEIERLAHLVLSLTPGQLHRLLEALVYSASLAEQAGFGLIQAHAAHGYLLSLLLDERINRRRDTFRQSGEWYERLVASLRSSAPSCIISIRLSCITTIASAHHDITRAKLLMARAAQAGADIIDLSAGYYTFDRRLIYPGANYRAPIYVEWLEELTATVPIPLCIAGRVLSFESIPSALRENLLVAIGRPLIADPLFIAKTVNNQAASIAHCQLSNRCHYFSRSAPFIECGVNPNL